MARPKKSTVDYFPHDTTHGSTMQILESRWGNDGYAFWFKLLELLGSHDSHYIDCQKPAEWEFLTAKTRQNDETAGSILQMLAKLEAIDSFLWTKHKVILCPKFLNRIEDAYRKRKDSFPTAEKVYSALNIVPSEFPAEETPLEEITSAGSTERERERERERKEKKDLKHLSEYSDDFLEFWSVYPVKTGKADAWKSWKKCKPLVKTILDALKWQANSQKWQDGYIPNPATYLNQRRWEDEPQTTLAIVKPSRLQTFADIRQQRDLEETRAFVEEMRNGR